MTKEELKIIFKKCRELKCGVIVDLKLLDKIYPERVITHFSNLNAMEKYYDKNYDNDLINKDSRNIRITNAKAYQMASFRNKY